MSRTDPVVSETTPGPKLRTEKARQGQNIQGMVTVLVASLVLVGIAYAVMLALSVQPDRKEAPPPSDVSQQEAPAAQQ